MHIEPVELQGERARLAPMEMGHASGLWEAAQAAEIWAYLPERPADVSAFEQWVRAALVERDKGLELPFVIMDRESGKVVGSTRLLDISVPHRSVEIGWTWLSPAVWRTRINTECKYLLLRHCFETLGMIRVTLKTDARNTRSQRAIERIGGVREGVLRHHRIMPDGYLRDSVYYSILEAEWPDVKSRLEGFLAGRA